MYIVLSTFDDLQDSRVVGGIRTYHRYHPGDAYPREGYSPTSERIRELLYGENKLRKPLIAVAQMTQIKIERREAPETEGLRQAAEQAAQAAKKAAKEAGKAAMEAKKASKNAAKKPAPKRAARPSGKKAGT